MASRLGCEPRRDFTCRGRCEALNRRVATLERRERAASPLPAALRSPALLQQPKGAPGPPLPLAVACARRSASPEVGVRCSVSLSPPPPSRKLCVARHWGGCVFGA